MSQTAVQNVGEDAFSGFGDPMPGDMPVLPDLSSPGREKDEKKNKFTE